MRFFGAPGVLLALGVSAAAGHSYHAFEHGYQPVTHEDFVHESHIAHPYEILNAAPEFHEDLHLDHGYVTYLEPHAEYHGLVGHDVHSHHEVPDFGYQEHQEQHENYVIHNKNEHLAKFGYKEEPVYHGNHDHHDHHEHHEKYVLHDNQEHNKKDHKEDHKNDYKKEHAHHVDQKHHGHDDDNNHKSVPKYTFKYGVNDSKTGDVKEQWESRTGDKVTGGYALKESDGTTRVVNYSADKKKGFEATVHKIGHPKGKHSEHGHHGH